MSEKHLIEFDDKSRTAVVHVLGFLDAAALTIPFGVVKEKYGVDGTNFLWDLTKCSFSDFSWEEIQNVAIVRKEHSSQRAKTKAAVLLNSDMKLTLARLFKSANFDSEPELMLFSEPDEARKYFGLSEDIELSV